MFSGTSYNSLQILELVSVQSSATILISPGARREILSVMWLSIPFLLLELISCDLFYLLDRTHCKVWPKGGHKNALFGHSRALRLYGIHIGQLDTFRNK